MKGGDSFRFRVTHRASGYFFQQREHRFLKIIMCTAGVRGHWQKGRGCGATKALSVKLHEKRADPPSIKAARDLKAFLKEPRKSPQRRGL
jgi:hypothetical protein